MTSYPIGRNAFRLALLVTLSLSFSSYVLAQQSSDQKLRLIMDSLSLSIDTSGQSIVIEGGPDWGLVKTCKVYDSKRHLIRVFNHSAKHYSMKGLREGTYMVMIDYGPDSYLRVIEIPDFF